MPLCAKVMCFPALGNGGQVGGGGISGSELTQAGGAGSSGDHQLSPSVQRTRRYADVPTVEAQWWKPE